MANNTLIDGVPSDAIFQDNDGKQWPALIVKARTSEVAVPLGNGKFRNESYPVADLRVDFGVMQVRKNENDQFVSLPTPKPISGVALKGTNPNISNKASYTPLSPSIDEAKAMEYNQLSREQLVSQLDELKRSATQKAVEKDSETGPDFDAMNGDELRESARLQGKKIRKDATDEQIREILKSAN